MLKFLLLPLNLAAVAFFTGFFTSDFEITQEAPNRIDSLSSCTVRLSIDKGDIKGFAKLQSNFPEGVELEEVETHGATFTFAQRKMKMIWMNLPEQDTFTVSYKLTVTDPDIVEVPLGGTFSYLDDNKRMTYDVAKHIMRVGPSKEEIKEKEKPRAYVYREIEDKGNDRYRVTVKVLSKYVTGFAKIEETVPYEASAEEVEAKEAVFSKVDNKVKFVWMSLPETDTFEVVYDLNLSNAVSQNTEDISGKFSYLYENATQKIEVKSHPQGETEEPEFADADTPDEGEDENEDTDETADAASAETETEEDEGGDPDTEEQAKEEDTEDPDRGDTNEIDTDKYFADTNNGDEDDSEQDQEGEEEAAEDTATDPEETTKDKVAGTAQNEKKSNDPASGVNYRVQILAGHNSVEEPYFKKKYNFTASFYVENHEGWIKYTTGDFGVYKQARDGREEVKANYEFPGPFVVAYNNDSRITVQEALMITNQKWIK